MNKYLIITSLGLLLCNNLDATKEINKEDYSLEFKRDRTFILFEKQTIAFPDGSTFTQKIPIKKLPEGLQVKQESSQEFFKKIKNKYAVSVAFELATLIALHLAKQFVSQKDHPHYHFGFNLADSVALGQFAATMLAMGYDFYMPHLAIEKNIPEDAAQFFDTKM